MAKRPFPILRNVSGQIAQFIIRQLLSMQLSTRTYLTLILAFLFAAGGQARRVIRAAPGIETTGRYIIVLRPETSHERFEAIAEKVKSESLISDIHTVEGPFAKMIVTKISVDEAYRVSLKILIKIVLYIIIITFTTVYQIKDLDNVDFVEEETFAKVSLLWALDRIDQVSPVLDGIFEPVGDGDGVDIYILDTGNVSIHYRDIVYCLCI